MKVRMLGNSIRLRLRKPEVTLFEQTGKILEAIEFGPELAGQLRFILEMYSANELTVTFRDNTVTIGVPQSIAME